METNPVFTARAPLSTQFAQGKTVRFDQLWSAICFSVEVRAPTKLDSAAPVFLTMIKQPIVS
jgi:hypothetical protein